MLDVLSADFGRIALVARGARRGKSMKALILQPYHKLLISWDAHGDLGTLTDVETTGTHYTLRGNAVYAGYYLNELTIRLLSRQETHGDLFFHYEQSLKRLTSEDDLEACLRNFEMSLLKATGFGLVLDHDVITGNPINPDKDYLYVFESGPTVVSSHMADDYINVNGKTLLALATGNFPDDQCRKQAKQLLRREIDRHLGSRPLVSRDLYRQFIRLSS